MIISCSKRKDIFMQQVAGLCMNESYADVYFVVQKERIPAHRVILAARSEYFRALLYGGMSEAKQNEIELHIPLKAFKGLLKYIYSGELPLSQIREDDILDILGLANQYGFAELENEISNYLKDNLDLNNVCAILDSANIYSLEKLSNMCLTFMDRNGKDLLAHESFKALSKDSLLVVLKRDSFFVEEEEIFSGVLKWCKHNPNVDVNSVASLVRLPLMSLQALLHIVRPSGILSDTKLLDAIDVQASTKGLPYRAAIWPEENVAIAKYSARVIQGESRGDLFHCDSKSYDLERGYIRHCITNENDDAIVVELGKIYVINYIKLLLWDLDERSYNYYVDVSANGTQWNRVVDYTKYHCRSFQQLYFEARPIRFIKIVGTFHSYNKVFHLVNLQAMYTTTVPRVVDGFIAPTRNVATIEMSAIVLDGITLDGITPNDLISGDIVNDGRSTFHSLGRGKIVVQLSQPYYLSTMRLLLWDLDDRTYCFYIETSVDYKNWQILVDKRNEHVRSWQNISFKPRPVVYIRIIGTASTANEIFDCVHLECPSQDPAFLQLQIDNARKGSTESNTSIADIAEESPSTSGQNAEVLVNVE